MKTITVTLEDADFFSNKEEDHFYDKKALEIDGRKVQKIAVALANADGGQFLIGIKDAKDELDITKRWCGAKVIEEFNSHLQALAEITPSIDMKYEILKCDQRVGYVLRVYIEKGSKIHKTSDNSIYQRMGAQSLKITDPQRILELSFAKGDSTYEDTIIQSIPIEQIVEDKEIKKFLNDFSPKTDPLDYVVNENLIDFNTWEPRICGLLLFHKNPPSVVPKRCGVKLQDMKQEKRTLNENI